MQNILLFSDVEDIKMHIAVLQQMAKADGIIKDAEQNFISNVISIYSSHIGIEETTQITEKTDELSSEAIYCWENSLKFRPVQAKNLLKDLITLGYLDMDFSNPEKDLVRDIALQAGITQDTVEKIAFSVRQIMEATVALNNLIFS